MECIVVHSSLVDLLSVTVLSFFVFVGSDVDGDVGDTVVSVPSSG